MKKNILIIEDDEFFRELVTKKLFSGGFGIVEAADGEKGLDKVKESKLLEGFSDDARFYFVHSYYCITHQPMVLTTTNYGYDFVSSFESENVLGVQFHPEKSHKNGMILLRNFLEKY